MREQKREFAEVLGEAQKLGYAEADPSFDIDGIDAAHKLAILAALAFGRPVDFGAVHVEGIRDVSALDIALAEELGYRIKLLGIARRDEAGISTRVHPCMVPVSAPIARVDGVFNAVVAEGDFVGRIMMEGRGAGGGRPPRRWSRTWSISRAGVSRRSGAPRPRRSSRALASDGEPHRRLLPAPDGGGPPGCDRRRDRRAARPRHQPGIHAPARPRAGRGGAVVLTTHETSEASVRAALARIAALDAVVEKPALIRIEAL